MKKIYLLLICIAFASCSNPQAELIADYEQTVLNTKTDLSLDVKEIEKIGEIKGEDSLVFYMKSIGTYTKGSEEVVLDSLISYYQSDSFFNDCIKSLSRMKIISKLDSKDTLECRNEAIENVKGLKKDLDKIKYYKNSGVLANKYKATYTIKNPLLNGAEQEITNVYLFSPDNKRILGKE